MSRLRWAKIVSVLIASHLAVPQEARADEPYPCPSSYNFAWRPLTVNAPPWGNITVLLGTADFLETTNASIGRWNFGDRTSISGKFVLNRLVTGGYCDGHEWDLGLFELVVFDTHIVPPYSFSAQRIYDGGGDCEIDLRVANGPPVANSCDGDEGPVYNGGGSVIATWYCYYWDYYDEDGNFMYSTLAGCYSEPI